MVNRSPELEAVFSALANRTRRSILETLRSGPRSLGELAEPFDMTLVGVSKHVDRLEEAGLVHTRRDGRRRVCRLDARPLRAGERWMRRVRSFWEAELDQVERRIKGSPPGD